MIKGMGPTGQKKLAEIDINTLDELTKTGSKQAFKKIAQSVDKNICVRMLYDMEAAIRGVKSKDLPADVKNDLKVYAAWIKL
ncbi:TfoX/Sxy family DNA transformation protein [Leuconostoc suionicum]|uniref:TfoX/Sxy family DNA transformation protein n=1 Tax=Leuconostoc suionicum TaxID=1511761 RepID=UPI004036FF5F